VIHPEFVGHGFYCGCYTCDFENIEPGHTAFVWADQSDSEPIIQELTVF